MTDVREGPPPTKHANSSEADSSMVSLNSVVTLLETVPDLTVRTCPDGSPKPQVVLPSV